MLETLQDIDWEKLSHAYGTAADLPKQLERLASDNQNQQQTALTALYGNIYHQGSIYDATVAAMPFLLEIALTGDTENRAELLFFIAHCCRTNMWNSQKKTAEAAWSREIIDLVDVHADDLLTLTATDEATESGVLACLFYCDDRPGVSQKILERIDEIHPSNTIIATLAAHSSEPEILDGFFDHAVDRSMRLAALIAKATIGGLSSEHVSILTCGIEDPDIRQPIIDVLDDVGGAIGSFAELMAMSTPDARPILVPSLCAFMEQSQHGGWQTLITLLGIGFPEPIDPVEPSSLSVQQRLILESAVRSSVWKDYSSTAELKRATGINASSASELAAFLGYEEPVIALIMTPSESPLVQHQLEQIDRLNWKNVPWMIFRGSTELLDEQIEEDADYFTETVMSEAKQIAVTIISNIADDIAPNLKRFRFYPNLSKAQLIAQCEKNGWTVHEAPVWAAELSSISEAEVMAVRPPEDNDPGLSWNQLRDWQRALIGRCVEVLDHAGWHEAKNWNAFVRDSGFPVTPLMVAKYYGLLDLEISYWPYDRAIARKTGKHTGDPYLLLTILESEGAICVRLYFASDLPKALRLLTRHQDALASNQAGFTSFLHDALKSLDRVMLEFDEGIVQELSLDGLD